MSTKERDDSERLGGGVGGIMRMEVPSHNVGHQFRKGMPVCQKRGMEPERIGCEVLIKGMIKIIKVVMKVCRTRNKENIGDLF